MTVRTLTLANSVDSAENVRLVQSGIVAASGPVDSRSGIFPAGSNPGNLVSAAAMQANITAFRAYIDGGGAALQGGYQFINDGNYLLTFANGEASVNRVDRVAAVVYHNLYDSSGFTIADVIYVKGQASGVANAIPATALLMWEVTVPAGTTAGGGGINFTTAAADKRTYTAAAGGTLNIGSVAERTAIANVFQGLRIYRTDQKWCEFYDGTAWRVEGVARVASFAGLSAITSPISGQHAYDTTLNVVYVYYGIFWGLLPGTFVGSLDQGAVQAIPDSTSTPLTFSIESDPFSWHSLVTNTDRFIPQIAGRYALTGGPSFSSNATGLRVSTWTLNGTAQSGSEARTNAVSGGSTTMAARPMSIVCNGTTDYMQLAAQQTSGASVNTNFSGSQRSHVDIYYAGPS